MSTECRRCLLNNGVPGVRIHDDGICSVCKEHDRRFGSWQTNRAQRLATLERMLNDCRRKKRVYDALVPISGGKDSTYALYLCRKRFNLRCLAVTWDNGFLADHARENIKRAVDTLGVDHIYYSLSWPLMRRIYRLFFLKTGFFCPVCMRGIDVATEMAAKAFDVPLVVNATCVRTEEYVAPEYFVPGRLDFFRKVMKNDPLEKEALPLFLRPDWKRLISYYSFWGMRLWFPFRERVLFSAKIELPDYVHWDYDEVYRTITDELGWRGHEERAEHTDCKVDNIVHYLRQRKFPALVPEKLRYSKLVTAGVMSKEDAIRKIADSPREAIEPANFDDFMHMLDISREQLEEVLSEPLRHMKYLEPSRLA